ncbi:MAG: chitobiase/beta-hexosaminidase C-terminal domain-containing protein [Clostridiales bacterium]|nr:chitobiase/beta-hexosaminidase C-terminal domain-containing protein [Clostridiales bacterium]
MKRLPLPQPTNGSQDPSGYIYEAVPSNRIEGVKATAYYYDYELDEFGMPAETKSNILWDAEDYDQINPMYSDVNGEYGWDVPEGDWLVTFTKDGYYDTTSAQAEDSVNGYLPVPPPQTEVNVAMVSKNAPEVETVNVYDSEIQIKFSQYMQPDTVNTDNVVVTVNGTAISGTITALDAEYDYAEENIYARSFVFTSSEALSGYVQVNISNVVNYNGTAIASSYTNETTAEVKPESISCSESINISYGSGALLSVAVLPAEAGANKTLTITSSSPSIAGVVTASATTDENGEANIMLEGKLPGQSTITISLDGTDLTASCTAVVANVTTSTTPQCAKVTASAASGSVLTTGSEIVLSTTTEGAEIYYTLDGTCPCNVDSESRIKYTEPITITDYTFIIAYAVKEGYDDSSTAGFIFYATDALTVTDESEYSLDSENGYVLNVSAKTSVSDFVSGFENTTVVILNANGNKVDSSSSSYVGTGFVIQNVYQNQVTDELTVIIKGELNSDGVRNVLDLARLFDHIQSAEILDGYYLAAAYMNGDEKIDVLDLASLFDEIQK